MAPGVYRISAAAGEYLICLVKKNEMLYSERDLYIFTKEPGEGFPSFLRRAGRRLSFIFAREPGEGFPSFCEAAGDVFLCCVMEPEESSLCFPADVRTS